MRAAVSVLLLMFALVCWAQPDGGGRDVRIALFSAQPPRSVSVSPAGPGAWWAPCPACAHRTLGATLHMPAVREIVAGGPLSVRNDERGEAHTANGLWYLRAGSGKIDVVLTLPSERYVAAVLMGETEPGAPPEYLRAMAVVARTFVLRRAAAREVPGRLASDVCDSTACQAIRLGPMSAAVQDAVRATTGETLWSRPGRAEVFFSQSCGGITESAGAMWPRLTGTPYLRSHPDPYCVRRGRAAWHGELPLATLQQIAAAEGWRLPPHIVSATVAARTASQRAQTITFDGDKGHPATVAASSLRLAVGRALGWNVLRSDAYDVKLRDGTLVFDGFGHGHGVGLCQLGAAEMAREGKSYRDILLFYFPGAAVRITQADGGWERAVRDGLTFATVGMLTAAQQAAAVDAWRFAQGRFPVAKPVTPHITFTPTTEIFRQLTSQPGWQLASTSGSDIVLQPAAVFAANHAALNATLRHEMLHVAVETSANANAPLWLREGLVECLAGDAAPAPPALSAEETERLLRSPRSREESAKAHAAAAARVRLLVERYGASSVRNWVVTGSSIPTG